MNQCGWRFYEQGPTDTVRNPISGEFFSSDAVGDVAGALVREALQNTLDARVDPGLKDGGAATARIYVSGSKSALSPTRAGRWFKDLWPHIKARGNGLRSQPEPTDRCPFLVYEDFGTIGLEGDPSAHLIVEGETNHFLNFFRAEGHSDKGASDRGSWGVGKTVFPRTSRISSFLGLSIRRDDPIPLLMGRSILKHHKVGTHPYKSDGYYGRVGRSDELVLPTSDTLTVSDFRQDFRLQRRDEPGLSIVIPWYDIEGDDEVTQEALVRAVIEGFFWPILRGQLHVTVAGDGPETTLNRGTIVEHAGRNFGSEPQRMERLVRLAEWAVAGPPARSLALPESEGAQRWLSSAVPPEVAQEVRRVIAARDRIAVRVPMRVEPRATGPCSTHFMIYLEGAGDEATRPCFVREGLLIPDLRPPFVSGATALVVVEDMPLAGMLRDAENPSHSQWSHDSAQFKNKYKFGPGAIRFVQRSVYELLRIIRAADAEPDPSLTIDYFSFTAPVEASSTRKGPGRTPEPGPANDPTAPKVDRTRRSFRIDPVVGGFSIRPGDPDAQRPAIIEVRLGYDVRRGSPLNRYQKTDFELGCAPINWAEGTKGVEVLSARENSMLLRVIQDDFQLVVLGFDVNRDLYVRAVAREADDVNA